MRGCEDGCHAPWISVVIQKECLDHGYPLLRSISMLGRVLFIVYDKLCVVIVVQLQDGGCQLLSEVAYFGNKSTALQGISVRMKDKSSSLIGVNQLVHCGDGSWHMAKLIQKRENPDTHVMEYYLHYDGLNRRMDETGFVLLALNP